MALMDLFSGGASGVSDAGSLLSLFGAGMKAWGSIESGNAAADFGRAQRVADQFAAEQLRVNAGQVIAAATIQELNITRQANLVTSRAQALAAASGGGALDPTVVNNVARISGEEAYRKATALYQGEDQARVMRMQAAAKDYEGALAEDFGNKKQDMSRITAGADILGGGASLFSRYAKDYPTTAKGADAITYIEQGS